MITDPKVQDGQDRAVAALTLMVHEDRDVLDLVADVLLLPPTGSVPLEAVGFVSTLAAIAERALADLAEQRGTTAGIELRRIVLPLAEHQAGVA